MEQLTVLEQEDETHEHASQSSFWRTRNGVILTGTIVASGLLLGIEYRGIILGSGLLVWLPLLLCVGMHFFMHDGHGGHGSGGDKS